MQKGNKHQNQRRNGGQYMKTVPHRLRLTEIKNQKKTGIQLEAKNYSDQNGPYTTIEATKSRESTEIITKLKHRSSQKQKEANKMEKQTQI
uniref:Uncharacterized protein n=1 Tax=Rhizophora mucronata TaxID=61149 RepID=A0A2P2P2C4_RHIMU